MPLFRVISKKCSYWDFPTLLNYGPGAVELGNIAGECIKLGLEEIKHAFVSNQFKT